MSQTATICARCGAVGAAGATSCATCGTPTDVRPLGPPASRRCPVCGTSDLAGRRSCPGCGLAIPGAAAQPSAPPASRRWSPWLLAVGAAALVLGTALAVLALADEGGRPLAERWRVALDGTPTGPVVTADDLALVVTAEGDVVAVDPGSGVPRWRFLSGQPPTAPLAAGNGVALLSTAAPGGGSTVFAVDLRTGEERWRLETEAAVTDAPVVDDAGVYVAQGDVRSVETGTGAERWRHEVAGGAGALAVAGGTLVATSGDGVVALDTGTGALRWGSGGGRPSVPPAVVRDVVVTTVDADGLVARALDGGAERWRAEDVGALLQPVVPGPGTVVAVTDEGIVALDAGDGTWRWRAGPRGDDRLRASAEASWMAAVSGAGHLVVDGVTGDVLAAGRWAGIDDDVEPAAPTMVQGDVLVHDGRGTLAALRPTSG